MPALLETERVTLRRFTEADADHLVDLDGDPDVMRYLSGGVPTPPAAIENAILPAFLASYKHGDGYGVWAAIERSGGDFLGWFSFRPLEGADPGEAALGYRLRKAVWGRGYATEVARALIRKGFTELGVLRVVATTYQDNAASRRVMEKVGMMPVRAYRMTPGQLLAQDTYPAASQEVWDGDDLEYALERADWERREAAGAR